jgi:hypothetical protein
VSRRLLAQVLAELGGPWSLDTLTRVERWLAHRDFPQHWPGESAVEARRRRLRHIHRALSIDPSRGNVPEPHELASLEELESRAAMIGETLGGSQWAAAESAHEWSLWQREARLYGVAACGCSTCTLAQRLGPALPGGLGRCRLDGFEVIEAVQP